MRKNAVDYKRALFSVALVVLGFLAWNGPLLWSVAKPEVVAVVPQLQIKAAEAAPASPEFDYPRLGISAPLHERADHSPLNSADWSQISQDLHDGVNLSYAGDSFDQARLAYVTGHSSDVYPHPYASIFAALNQAREGDSFHLTVGGKTFMYKVVGTRVVNPRDVAAFTDQPSTPRIQRVLLVTCTPLLTTRQRLIVIGERTIL